jgi:hypothetical protein
MAGPLILFLKREDLFFLDFIDSNEAWVVTTVEASSNNFILQVGVASFFLSPSFSLSKNNNIRRSYMKKKFDARGIARKT